MSKQSDDPGTGHPSAIGRYRVIRPLGRGGGGIVYLGEDPDLGRRVALKMLPGAGEDPDALARLGREAKTLAAIDHPSVATVYSLETGPAGPAIIMEYVAGVTLAERLTSGPLGVSYGTRVLLAVAQALEAVHAQGIIHRDLKPANVMLMPDRRVKVVDFGLALGGDATRTDGFAGAGTPGYMSPEQLRGEPLDPRADLFALAVIAWECFTGAPAFPGETELERITATLEHRPDASKLPADLPAPVRELLTTAFETEIEARPQSAPRVVEVLRGVVAEESRETALDTTQDARRAPSRLPADPSRFVGREREMDEIVVQLDTSRLVTLTGVGGTGKTRLAIAAARRLRSSAPDGVFFCALAPVARPDQVAGALARALEVPELLGQGIEESIDTYVARRELLVVVDNCEHVLQSASALVERLLDAGPGVRVVATSRESLGIAGEVVYYVPPLTLPDASVTDEATLAKSDAVRLFTERARRQRPEFAIDASTAAAVAEICRRVDGIPLAIELAAARLRVLTAEEIAQRLGKRLRLLTGGVRNAPARHRTLRAAIDWSCDPLSDEERTFFHRLAVFSGGFTLEAAEAICPDDPADADLVLDQLTQLVQKSLVEANPDGRETRYRLLECVREYAAEHLEEDVGDRVAARHADYYQELSVRAAAGFFSPEQARWLTRYAREYENLRDAIASYEARGDLRAAVETACNLTRFWETRARFLEGLALLGRLIVVYGPDRRDPTFARLVNDTGLLAYAHGDDKLARARYEEALEVWEALGDAGRIAASLNNLGLVTERSGDIEGAIVLFERALAINRKTGNRSWESTNLLNRGFCHRHLQRIPEARRDLEAALEILNELGDEVTLAAAYDNLGTLAQDEGNFAEARDYHERALAIHQKLDNPRGISIGLGNLGLVAQEEGDFTTARELHAESLRIKRDLDAVIGICFSLESIASLAAAEKKWTRAATLLGAAHALRARIAAPMPEPDRVPMEAAMERARRAEGKETIERAWARGAGLTTEAAIQLALDGV